MVSDYERNWGHWGRAGVTRSGLCSPTQSPIRALLGPIGAGGCHALRGLWSPMVSDHELSRARACGRGRVSRVSGLRSPITSTIGGPAVFDHEHNWDHWGLVGVTRFGPVIFPQKELFGALSSEKSATRLARRVAHAWVRGLPWSPHECNGAGWVSRGPVTGVWKGVTRLGPWSPMVSAHERNGPGS